MRRLQSELQRSPAPPCSSDFFLPSPARSSGLTFPLCIFVYKNLRCDRRLTQGQTLILPISLDPSRASGAGQVGNNLTAPLSQRDPWARLFGTRDPERQLQAGGKRNTAPPSSFGDAATCGEPCAVDGPPISVRHYLCRVGRPECSRGLPSHAIFLERDSISGLPAMTPHPFFPHRRCSERAAMPVKDRSKKLLPGCLMV